MRLTTVFTIVLTLVLSLFIPSISVAFERIVPRYALVIGNGSYKFSPLKNPANDAADMASTLRSLRYEVTVVVDQNPAQMRDTVTSFYNKIKQQDAISVFYYAGHAIQANNINYLIPVNAKITSYDSMKTEAFSINELLYALKRASSKQNIIILDACRNNPFKIKNVDNTLAALPKGLAPIEAPTGTLIAYATEPGNVASDGKGENGTYTSALLRHITQSETAEALFKKVRKDVLSSTSNRQTPWEHSSLVEKFYFMPPSNEEIPDIIGF